MVTILRPLSLSELLDRTFFLYRKHFVLFVGIVALPELAVLGVRVIGDMLHFYRSPSGILTLTFITLVVNLFAVTVAQAATVIAVSDLHLDRPASIGSAYSAIKTRLIRIIGIIFGVDIAIGVGCLLLLVPGIYLGLTWALCVPVTVLEGTGLSATAARSSTLTKGDKGRIFVVGFLLVVLTWIVTIIINIPLIMLVTLSRARGSSAILEATRILSSSGAFVSTSLVGPLLTIALTLLYFDNRVRKEGFDLQLMMATLQPAPQTVSATTV
jgi:hypothetical protein